MLSEIFSSRSLDRYWSELNIELALLFARESPKVLLVFIHLVQRAVGIGRVGTNPSDPKDGGLYINLRPLLHKL